MGARVGRGTPAESTAASLADPPGDRRLPHSFTEKNHACEEKRREKGCSEVHAQVHAEEGGS